LNSNLVAFPIRLRGLTTRDSDGDVCPCLVVVVWWEVLLKD